MNVLAERIRALWPFGDVMTDDDPIEAFKSCAYSVLAAPEGSEHEETAIGGLVDAEQRLRREHAELRERAERAERLLDDLTTWVRGEALPALRAMAGEQARLHAVVRRGDLSSSAAQVGNPRTPEAVRDAARGALEEGA